MAYKVLIIGLGKIGLEYDLDLNPEEYVYSHSRAFTVHLDFDVVGGVDTSQSKRKLFEAHYKKVTYSNISKALVELKPNVVVIAAPTKEHLNIVKEISNHLESGIILCEKPLAYDISEAKEIVSLCKNKGLVLFVNYMRISDKSTIEIKNRIIHNYIQTPIKATAWYSKGFLHNCSHLFNLFEFWLGECISSKILDYGRHFGEYGVEIDVHVNFKLGSVVFRSAWEEKYTYSFIDIVSPSGRLHYDKGGNNIKWQKVTEHPFFNGYRILSDEVEKISNDLNYYQLNVVKQLSNYLQNKRGILCTGEQALTTIENMYNIFQKK